MSLSPCSTDPCSLCYAVLPSVFSPLSLLGNSLSTDSASLAQSQENSPEDETEAIQGEFFFFSDFHVYNEMYTFSCIQLISFSRRESWETAQIQHNLCCLTLFWKKSTFFYFILSWTKTKPSMSGRYRAVNF